MRRKAISRGLIRAGHRVAIAEQIETPEEAKKCGGSKALVAREIVRFVTAGTLTEEALLDPRSANVLAAVCEMSGGCGVASVDISTGRMELEECAPDALAAVLARISPGEAIAAEPSPREGGDFKQMERKPPEAPASAGSADSHAARSDFRSEAGEARLKALFGAATLDGLGDFTRPMLAAAGGLIAYLEHVGRGTLPLLLPPVARRGSELLAMDAATRASLEVLEAQGANGGGGRAGSLLAAVDRCSTARGRGCWPGTSPHRSRTARQSRRATRRWRFSTAIPSCAAMCAGCCASAPTSRARSGGSSPGAAVRAISARCATVSAKRGGCARWWRRAPTCRSC